MNVRRFALRLMVLSAAPALFSVPSTPPVSAGTRMCADAPRPTACAALSEVLLELMDAVAPGTVSRLADALAAGYRLSPDLAVTCTLGVTCDAWPVALIAASTVPAPPATCPFGSDAVCAAVRGAADADDVAPVVEAVRAVAADVAAAPRAERVPVLSGGVGVWVSNLDDVPGARTLADAVVGVVVLALTLPPAHSPGALAPPAAHVVGVEVIDDGATPEAGNALTAGSPGDPGVTVTGVVDAAKGQRCRARFNLFASLETWPGSRFTEFEVWADAGIHDLRWTDLNELHTRCPEPRATWNGAMFAEAISNAGSFIASNTKRSPLEQSSETLFFGPDYVAATSIRWETAKVHLVYDFPVAFTIDNYAPPVGNYVSEATGSIGLLNGYVRSTRRTSSIEVEIRCTKYGNEPAACPVTS